MTKKPLTLRGGFKQLPSCIVGFLRGGPFFSGFFNGLFWAPPTLSLGAMLDPGGGTGTGTNLFHDHFVCLLAIGKSLSD